MCTVAPGREQHKGGGPGVWWGIMVVGVCRPWVVGLGWLWLSCLAQDRAPRHSGHQATPHTCPTCLLTAGSNPSNSASHQLPVCALGKQWRTAQSLRTLHQCGKPARGSGLLASDWLSSGHCSHLGSESTDRRSSLSLLLSLYLTFQ